MHRPLLTEAGPRWGWPWRGLGEAAPCLQGNFITDGSGWQYFAWGVVVMEENGSYEKVTREKTEQLRKDFDKHEKEQGDDMVRMWTAIDNLRNRPPIWATVVIAILAGACGWLKGAS